MTTDDRFDRTLSSWLEAEAAHRVPDHLAEILVQTVATPQRPWWSSLERLLPMTTVTTGRVTSRQPILWFAVLSLLVLATLAAVLLAGALRTTPVPIGLPSNGRIVVADGPMLVSYAADGTDRRVVVDLRSAGSSALSMSPDGTRVAMSAPDAPAAFRIVNLADGTSTQFAVDGDAIAEEPIGWSPDGRSIVFAGLRDGVEVLFVAAADGSVVNTPLLDKLDPQLGIWQPSFSPDGEWIAFGAGNRLSKVGELYVTRPDGTGLRPLATAQLTSGDGGNAVWSPAADQHRIAYLSGSPELSVRVADVDAGTDHEIGPGFWPSWSPDGTQLATCCATVWDVEDAIAGRAVPRTVFAQTPEGGCGDFLDWSGRAICSLALWSPDGKWLIAADVARDGLLIAPVDGSVPPRRLSTDTLDSLPVSRLPAAWQPVWP